MTTAERVKRAERHGWKRRRRDRRTGYVWVREAKDGRQLKLGLTITGNLRPIK